MKLIKLTNADLAGYTFVLASEVAAIIERHDGHPRADIVLKSGTIVKVYEQPDQVAKLVNDSNSVELQNMM